MTSKFFRDKIPVRAIIFGLTILLTSGCAALKPDSTARQAAKREAMEKQIAARNYHKALLLLKEAEPDENTEAYRSQRRRIDGLENILETEAELKATRLSELNDLREAIDILDQTLKKIPENSQLQEMRRDLVREREVRQSESARNLLLSEAEYLFSQLEWHDEQELLENSSFMSRWRKSRLEESLRSLHGELLLCGQEALAARQEPIAERCLQMAKAIDDTKVVKELLARIDSDPQAPSVVSISEAKKTRPASSSSTSFQTMEEELQKNIDKGQLIRAYEILAKLEQFPGSTEKLHGYRKQLDKRKKSRITKLHKEASRLYRSGQIAEARSTWQQILALDPDNHTAVEKIARADKVLKKLQYLQDSQQEMPASR
jgi:tetratricopeptide (TPR) repeat protein